MKGKSIWNCKDKLHYGKPAKLFGDADKDGVANVFDCKPYNRRRQDFKFNYTAKQKAIEELENERKENESREKWDKIKDELGID